MVLYWVCWCELLIAVSAVQLSFVFAPLHSNFHNTNHYKDTLFYFITVMKLPCQGNNFSEATRRPSYADTTRRPSQTDATRRPSQTDATRRPSHTDSAKKPSPTQATKSPRAEAAGKEKPTAARADAQGNSPNR